jgi:anti-sigma factor RsiW
MSCDDARARFSELADGQLDAAQRAAVETHVTTCTECQQQWVAFGRTLSLLHALPRHRAPAGFAERVLAATHPSPTPWPRRLARRWFLPLSAKLPLHAAALVLIVGAVWLVHRAPEFRQLAETPPPPVAPTESRPGDELAPTALVEGPPATPRRAMAPPRAGRDAPAALAGHLTVDNREAAERALVDLMTRVGVTEVARAQAPEETVVELQLPLARYPEFARGLAGIGRWRPETQPVAGDLEMRLRVVVRRSAR